MPVNYAYSQAILGSQSTYDGSPVNYDVIPAAGGNWRWSGSTQTIVVQEAVTGTTIFDGDPTNETVSAGQNVGQANEQSVNISGTDRAIVYDYAFTVSRSGVTYTVAVFDVDLNGDGLMNSAGEDGTYLVFIGAVPPANRNLRMGPLLDNSNSRTHASLGGSVVCFTAGTSIDTLRGPVPVQNLSAGDLVLTLDHGPQPIRWIGARKLGMADLCANPNLCPVLLAQGSLGPGLPERDLLVSPQHRMMIRSKVAERLLGAAEVLIPAVKLVGTPGITVCDTAESVEYYHILFDAHEIVWANGAPAESLYLGPQAHDALQPAARAEIAALFPEAFSLTCRPEPARPIVERRKQTEALLERHLRHGRPLLAPAAMPAGLRHAS